MGQPSGCLWDWLSRGGKRGGGVDLKASLRSSDGHPDSLLC